MGDDAPTRFLSLYLPNGEQQQVVRAATQAFVVDDVPTFAGGDINLQLAQARPGEEDSEAAVCSV